MTKKKIKNRRNFGGRGKVDWFTRHESIDPDKGLTATQAGSLAGILRAAGYAAKIDHLGGKGRKGVYYRESKAKQHVKLGTVPQPMLRTWFRERTKTKREPYYESTVSNFIAQNPQLICGRDNKHTHVWREQELGDSEIRDKSQVDVIIETEKDLWVIEVKYTEKFDGAVGPLKNAAEKIHEYHRKIRNLGWWKDKNIRLAIIWGVCDEIPSTYTSFYESHELPFRP
jgi:hypothetical protein